MLKLHEMHVFRTPMSPCVHVRNERYAVGKLIRNKSSVYDERVSSVINITLVTWYIYLEFVKR